MGRWSQYRARGAGSPSACTLPAAPGPFDWHIIPGEPSVVELLVSPPDGVTVIWITYSRDGGSDQVISYDVTPGMFEIPDTTFDTLLVVRIAFQDSCGIGEYSAPKTYLPV